MVQSMHAFELNIGGFYHATTCHDGINAFWSMSHSHLDSATAPPFVATAREHSFVKQRIHYAVIVLGHGTPEMRYLLVKCGVVPGDHAGPMIFNQGILK